MAIDGLVKSGQESKWGFLQETTFGTVSADTANYIMVESGMPSIDYGVTQVQEQRHGRGRGYDINDGYVSEKSGTRVISVPDFPVRRADLAELWYAVLQTVVEGATAPYQKDFDLTNAITQPDFSSNAGYFATLFIDNVLSAKDQKFVSCILRSLTLKANTSEGDGRLMAAGEWISGFQSVRNVTLSGTPAYNAQNYYEFSSPSVQTIAGADVVVMDWELTVTNNAVRVGNDTNGDAQTYACGMPYDVTGSITVKWDTATDAHLDSWLAGTAEAIQLSVGTSGTAGYFDLQIPKAEYTGNERNHDDQRGQLVTLPFKAGFNGSTNDLINVQVDDGVDQAW